MSAETSGSSGATQSFESLDIECDQGNMDDESGQIWEDDDSDLVAAAEKLESNESGGQTIISGFQTASLKPIFVSQEAMDKAMELFDDLLIDTAGPVDKPTETEEKGGSDVPTPSTSKGVKRSISPPKSETPFKKAQ